MISAQVLNQFSMMEISHFFKHDPDFCDHRDRILSEEF
jgi:hypothetical protein